MGNVGRLALGHLVVPTTCCALPKLPCCFLVWDRPGFVFSCEYTGAVVVPWSHGEAASDRAAWHVGAVAL